MEMFQNGKMMEFSKIAKMMGISKNEKSQNVGGFQYPINSNKFRKIQINSGKFK
jgi:hypothetical protein